MSARIVYVYAPARIVSGGMKAAFQHVEMLVAAGVDAVMATPDGVPPDWFQSTAPIIRHEALTARDVLVLPENLPELFRAVAAFPNRKLVFCQSPYLVYQGMGTMRSYADAGVSQIMCVSQTVMNYCRLRFPGMPLAYTPYCVDEKRFAPAATKKLQICTAPGKRSMEIGAIHDLFRFHNPRHRHVDWLLLQNASEAEVAARMAESAVFLSLSRLEANPMTVLEAMASGCIVAGFTGVHGGNDSATSGNGFWVREDDLEGCAAALSQAVQVAEQGGPVRDAMLAESRRMAAQYSRQEVSRLLVAFWRSVLR